MAGEKERIDAYLNTIARLEPEIAMIDLDVALASIAISMRGINVTLKEILDELQSQGAMP